MEKLDKAKLGKLLNNGSLAKRFEAMHEVNLNRDNIPQVLSESSKKSKADLNLTSKAILLRSTRGDFEEAFELTKWSLKAKPESRKIVVGAFIRNRQSSFLVHQMARLKRADASNLMKDYFSEGGNIKNVAEWLTVAGGILKTGMIPDDTDGLWGWIKETAEDVVDTVVGAINTVADAIEAAGESLADAITSVVTWSQSKINDFVEAILRTGQKVGDILSEAAKKGTTALNKFINAIIEAGRQALEIINWAINKSANILRSVLRKLLRIIGSFTSLLIEVAKVADSKLSKIVRALLDIGKKVRDFVVRINRIAYSVGKRIIQEIRRAGKSVREIMSALLNRTRYIFRLVLDALISLNINISNMFREVISWSSLKLKNIIGALKDLGISLSRILDGIAEFAGAQALKLMQALRRIWSRVKDILRFIATKSERVIRTLLVALLGTGIHIKNVLKSIIIDLRSAFRESLIKGLIQIGKSALILMKEVVKISASAAAVLFAILMEILGSHRGLTAAERAEAEKIFGSSINLDMVRLTNASFTADFIMWINSNRPFTTMYVINYKSGKSLSNRLLIHELTHIWQAVNSGGVYMLEALHSQFFGKAYNVSDRDLRKAKGKLENLEREQQAVVVEEYWRAEFNGETIPLDIELVRPLAQQVHKSRFQFNPIRIDFDIDGRIINPVIPPISL